MKSSLQRPRVLLADDHTLVAEGISRLLEDEFELIGIADNGRHVLETAKRLAPEVVILDISMPQMNGIEAARQLRTLLPETKIVFLTMHSDRVYVSEALRAGAMGYLLKKSAATELVHAIRTVLAGEVYLTPLLGGVAVATAREGANSQRPLLTQRQREVLQLIAEGHSAKSMAEVLRIAVKTAEFHRAAIMDKLGLRSTAELTRYAIEQKMINTSGDE
ncbi:MAG TPA: response regulator transcription factor [Bryobacteraceae bacterium]|nr:response regulator transcription factor [Bryobacteraceae bacterium]